MKWRIILVFPFQPAVKPSMQPLVEACKFSVVLQTACLGLLILHRAQAVPRWMESAAEKEHPEEANVCCSNSCNDACGGTPEREQSVSRRAVLRDNAVFFREEVRRAFWQSALLIAWVQRCWTWLDFSDGWCHAFADSDLVLQLPTQRFCSSFALRTLTAAAQLLGAEPNL